MIMRPEVFLSHSKEDAEFVRSIANDLRLAQIKPWFDDWEIGPGDSLRDKIFDEGISDSDLFFVYITPNSVDSNWVQRELDAAFTRDVNQEGGSLAIFVDSDETREGLSPDLASKSCPILNEEEYTEPLLKLVSKAWQSKAESVVERVREEDRMEKLELENQVKDLELKVERLKSGGRENLSQIEEDLESHKVSIGGNEVSLFTVFRKIANDLAAGADVTQLTDRLMEYVDISGLPDSNVDYASIQQNLEEDIADYLGPLVIKDLAKVTVKTRGRATGYELTELGRRLASHIQSSGGAEA